MGSNGSNRFLNAVATGLAATQEAPTPEISLPTVSADEPQQVKPKQSRQKKPPARYANPELQALKVYVPEALLREARYYTPRGKAWGDVVEEALQMWVQTKKKAGRP